MKRREIKQYEFVRKIGVNENPGQGNVVSAQRSTTAPMMPAVSSTPWFMNAMGIGVGLDAISL